MMAAQANALTRRLAQAAIWLAAGVAFAWVVTTIRAFAPDPKVPYAVPLDLGQDIQWMDRTMPAEIVAWTRRSDGSSAWRLDGMRQVLTRFGEDLTHLRAWRRGDDGVVDKRVESTVHAWRLRRGFPFRSLEGSWWFAGGATEPTDVALLRLKSAGPEDYVIPLRILWWGLIANGLVFGAFLLLLTRLPTLTEHWWRRRNHRCAACGHALAGAARCFECGHEAPDAGTMRA